MFVEPRTAVFCVETVVARGSEAAYLQQTVTESVPDTEPLALVELPPVQVGGAVMLAAPSCMEVKLSPELQAGVSFEVMDPGPPVATVQPEMLNFWRLIVQVPPPPVQPQLLGHVRLSEIERNTTADDPV